MPRIVRLYLVSIAIGFVLAVVFTGLLLWLDVADLRHLILSSRAGALAAAMLIVFNTIVFSGAQFGIAVMQMDDSSETGRGKPLLNHGAMRPSTVTDTANPRR